MQKEYMGSFNIGAITSGELVSLFNGISTFVGYLMPSPFESSRKTVVVLCHKT